jgi:hypothetical protein
MRFAVASRAGRTKATVEAKTPAGGQRYERRRQEKEPAPRNSSGTQIARRMPFVPQDKRVLQGRRRRQKARTRARCGEVGDRSICRQPAGAGRLSFSRLSRTSLSGFWRLVPFSQIQSNTGTDWRETVRKYTKGTGRIKNGRKIARRDGRPISMIWWDLFSPLSFLGDVLE